MRIADGSSDRQLRPIPTVGGVVAVEDDKALMATGVDTEDTGTEGTGVEEEDQQTTTRRKDTSRRAFARIRGAISCVLSPVLRDMRAKR